MDIIDAITSRIAGWVRQSAEPLPLDQLHIWSDEVGARIHIAVMVEPYMSKVCSGEKFIESRLTRVNIAPFKRAGSGDIILFKLSGGPVVAVAQVERTRYEELGLHRSPATIAEAFASGLGYEPGYVESKSDARFASLLWLSNVRRISAIPIAKSSRHAWLTFQPTSLPGSSAMTESGDRLF
jgi:hypothetical protein